MLNKYREHGVWAHNLMEMYMTDWIHLSVFDTLKHEYKTLTWMGRILSSDEAQNIYEIIGTEFNSAES